MSDEPTTLDDLCDADDRIAGLEAWGASLAARVARLEAALDRAERLAAAEAYYSQPGNAPDPEQLEQDTRNFAPDHPWHDEYLAAVRAVTRANAAAPPPDKQNSPDMY